MGGGGGGMTNNNREQKTDVSFPDTTHVYVTGETINYFK